MIPKTARILAWAAAGGCLGGGLNAVHALLTLSEDLKWHIVPAGALHGGLLALLSLASARLLLRRPPWQGILGLPLLGWACGYLTFFPLALSAGFDLSNFYLFRGSNLLDSPGSSGPTPPSGSWRSSPPSSGGSWPGSSEREGSGTSRPDASPGPSDRSGGGSRGNTPSTAFSTAASGAFSSDGASSERGGPLGPPRRNPSAPDSTRRGECTPLAGQKPLLLRDSPVAQESAQCTLRSTRTSSRVRNDPLEA